MKRSRVAVNIVSYNSDRYLESCLQSLKAQTFRDFSISIWDNASRDATHAIILAHQDQLDFYNFSKENLGFCKAHNRLIRETVSDYTLVLNPDVILAPDFLERIVSEMELHPEAGSATGKLFRQTALPYAEQQSAAQKILDSTGMYFTPNQRHFDRGSGEVDQGQFDKMEYVFGASGAAAFYRRTMLDDLRYEAEYFDESFFAYREDADLAWRALWLGWKCLYVPDAIAYHARQVLPKNRSTYPDIVNMHSFKNRFLLRAKNMDGGTWLRFLIPITIRDLAALSYVLLREHASLRAIPLLLRTLPRALAWRKSIQSRKRVSATDLRRWFKIESTLG